MCSRRRCAADTPLGSRHVQLVFPHENAVGASEMQFSICPCSGLRNFPQVMAHHNKIVQQPAVPVNVRTVSAPFAFGKRREEPFARYGASGLGTRRRIEVAHHDHFAFRFSRASESAAACSASAARLRKAASFSIDGMWHTTTQPALRISRRLPPKIDGVPHFRQPGLPVAEPKALPR